MVTLQLQILIKFFLFELLKQILHIASLFISSSFSLFILKGFSIWILFSIFNPIIFKIYFPIFNSEPALKFNNSFFFSKYLHDKKVYLFVRIIKSFSLKVIVMFSFKKNLFTLIKEEKEEFSSKINLGKNCIELK